MKDVVLARNDEKRNEAISTINEDEKEVYRQLDIIRNLILGDEGKHLEKETRDLFAGWKPIRQEIITLSKQGKNDEAAKISTNEDAAYYERIAGNNQKLNDYAMKKAGTFIAALKSHNRRTIHIFGVALFAVSLLTLGTAGVIFRSILFNLNVLKVSMEQSSPTGNLLEAEVNGANEITNMTISYNALVKALREHRDNLEAIIDKRTEELNQSLEWFATTLRSIGDAVITTDKDGAVSFMNPVAEELTGWKFWDARDKPLETVFNIVNEQTRKPVENPVKKVLETGTIVGLANHTVLISKNGREYPIVDSGAPIISSNSDIAGVILVFRDDSDRRNVESSLEAERNTLDSIMESIPDLLTIHNLDCELTYMNGTARKMFGDRIGEKCHSVFENRDKACNVCPVKSAVRDGKAHVCIREATLPSGEKTYWENTGIPIKDASGQIAAGIEIRKNITERVKTENNRRRMREHEKHAIVGRVAGKMAHDFNNVLGIILGTSELLMSETLPSEISEEIGIIKESALRGREITRNLLVFAKDQEPKLSLLDINEKISTIIKSLKSELKTIDVTVNYGPDLEPLLADAGLIESAVVNMIQNAIHALSKTPNPKLKICTYTEKTNICIEIEDNGCGIPGEYVDKIFDPLFTLKGSADRTGAYRSDIKGNGYGLANVKRCIDKHNGTIKLCSQEGQGAKFKICLPVIKAELNEQEMRSVQGMQISGGKKILLVEDETHLARILYSLLGKFDHSVDLASDARMALDHVTRNNYDAVSLDFILPDMNGMEVYKNIRETNKDIPIIFVSGNFEFMQSMLDLKKQDPNVDHITKPFENVEYLNILHKWLGAKDNATNF